MTYKEIQDLIKLVSKSELSEVQVANGDFKITVRNKNYTKGSNSAPTMMAPTVIPAPVASAPAPEAPAAAKSAPASAPSSAEESAEQNLLEIRSPIVGTFYRAPSEDKPPFVSVGDSVSQGSVVCIVEAMKLFNEIESEVTGKIVKVMVENASPVEYDQVLFLVDPKG